MIKNISNLGDAAVYCDFGSEIDIKINTNVINFFKSVKKSNIEGITNLAPSYNKLIITFDLAKTNYLKIKKDIENLKILNLDKSEFKKIEIPICFDESFALDIDRINKKLNLTKEEIINTHLNKEYFCYMTGFIAGMPFLGDINEKLRLNRLETPRVKVPKGSVGVTEQFANIYTFESPGGWNIIGNTPQDIFDSSKEKEPNLINPGDIIVFKKITLDEYKNYNE